MDFPIVPDCERMSGCRGVMVVGIASAKVMGMGVAGQGLDKWRLTRPRRSIVSASAGLDQIYGGMKREIGDFVQCNRPLQHALRTEIR